MRLLADRGDSATLRSRNCTLIITNMPRIKKDAMRVEGEGRRIDGKLSKLTKEGLKARLGRLLRFLKAQHVRVRNLRLDRTDNAVYAGVGREQGVRLGRVELRRGPARSQDVERADLDVRAP